jgi:hypothetical protein
MSKSLATTTPIQLPNEMASLINDAPLVGQETNEEFEALLAAIANAMKPLDFIAWQCVGRITDLAWYIRRERILKTEIIKIYHKEIVSELLGDIFNNPMLGVSEDAQRWERDPSARRELNQRLAKKGHTPDSVLAQAHIRGADQIEASDKRTASYEARSFAILREAGLYNEKLTRRVDQATSDAVDAEFTEAAE